LRLCQTWPGLLLLVLLVAAAAYLITSSATDARDKATVREQSFAQKQSESLDIGGGSSDTTVGDDIVSDDGTVGNPKSYPKSGKHVCTRL
jgi:endoglucanase